MPLEEDDDDDVGTYCSITPPSPSEDEMADVYEPPKEDYKYQEEMNTDGTSSLIEEVSLSEGVDESDVEMNDDDRFDCKVRNNVNNNNNAANTMDESFTGIQLDEDTNEIIFNEDGSELIQEDDANDDLDESTEDLTNRDHAQSLSQRRSKWEKNVFIIRSNHQIILTDEGIRVLQSSNEGKLALSKLRAEQRNSSTTRTRKRAQPERCKSFDIVQLLINSPARHPLHPIVVHNDEIRLKINMTVTFPGGRRKIRTIGPKEFHESDQKNVIVRFFHENREALGIRQVNALEADTDVDYFIVLLSLNPTLTRSNCYSQAPLAILESITMTIRSTNCGHRHIHPDVQQCRREAVYRALTSSRLPENLRSLLERLLTRTVQLDFAKRYGPLFDFTYSQRLSEVEGHVSRISRSIAEMSLKHKKLLSAIQDDEDEDLVESDDVLSLSGHYRSILTLSSEEISQVNEEARRIQKDLMDRDKEGILHDDLKLLSSKDYPNENDEAAALQHEARSALPISSQLLPSSQASTSSIRVSFLSSSKASSSSSSRASFLESSGNTPSSSQTSLQSNSSARSARSGYSSQRPIRNAVASLPTQVYTETRSCPQEDPNISSTGDMLQVLFDMHNLVNDEDSRDDFFRCADEMLNDYQDSKNCLQAGSIDEEVMQTWEVLENVAKRYSDNDNTDEAFKIAGDILHKQSIRIASARKRSKRSKRAAREQAERVGNQGHDQGQEPADALDMNGVILESTITKHQRSGSGDEEASQGRKSLRLDARRQQSLSGREEANETTNGMPGTDGGHLRMIEVNRESSGVRRDRYEVMITDEQSRAGNLEINAMEGAKAPKESSILPLVKGDLSDLNKDRSISPFGRGDSLGLSRDQSILPFVRGDSSDLQFNINGQAMPNKSTCCQSDSRFEKDILSLKEMTLNQEQQLEEAEEEPNWFNPLCEDMSRDDNSQDSPDLQTQTGRSETDARQPLQSESSQSPIKERKSNRSIVDPTRIQDTDDDDGPEYTVLSVTRVCKVRGHQQRLAAATVQGSSQDTAILIESD